MLNSIRPVIDKTKVFVKKHRTAVACTATAVVTAYVVHDREVGALKAIAARQMLAQDDQLAMLLDTTSFIDAKGLSEEFFDFAPRMIRD